MKRPTGSGLVAALSLLAIAAHYAYWFHDDGQRAAAWLVLVLPPLLLTPGVVLGGRLSRFWAGVLALLWFCHGVMETWSATAMRVHGVVLLLQSLLVVFALSWPALRAKSRARPPRGNG